MYKMSKCFNLNTFDVRKQKVFKMETQLFLDLLIE